MKWLGGLPQEERDQVASFAVARREKVKKDSKDEQELIKTQRTKKNYMRENRGEML